jgi:hypothetical protein
MGGLMANLFLDSESCGLHSQAVLLQYAYDDGPITLYEPWREPIGKTLQLIEEFMRHNIIGFNLAFDMFLLAKMYTIFRLFPIDWIPEQHIQEIALREPEGRDGPCIKPKAACDLLLHSRKGKYQSLMAREDIRIKRVPAALAPALAEHLEKTIELDGIYFAKTVDKTAPRWKVMDILSKKTGAVNQDFKDVVLKFNAAGGLKYLAEYALGLTPKHYFSDVELDTSYRPAELGYAPTALAIASAPNWDAYDAEGKPIGFAWPGVIKHHIEHWATNEPAREYALDDIVYTRKLWEHFDKPQAGDNDSELACMVAVVRWHGFAIDTPGIEELLEGAKTIVADSPVNINKPQSVRKYITACMDDLEAILLEESTKKANIEQIREWYIESEEVCGKCDGKGKLVHPNKVGVTFDCLRCEGKGKLQPGPHPAAVRAKHILEIKIANKEIELYDKLLKADRFHASFKVIGTLSSRMSGGDGLNAQGISHAKSVRKMFPLAWPGYTLCGGDFASFEVTIADAVFSDPALRQTLLEGKKIHALLGMELFPGHTYEEIVASEGSKILDMYTKGKQGIFGFFYGGDFNTWNQKLGVPLKQAEEAYHRWCAKYKGIGDARMRIHDDFCSMRQPAGIGTQVVWKDPADYVETFLGFRRYFTLENKICKALFELASNTPKLWKQCPIQCVRRDRVQTVGGAVSSALYGAAFQIQAANMRASNNHLIQSPGAEITKHMQRRIWDLQPAGVNEFVVLPCNVHDEIMCVTHPDFITPVAERVREAVEFFRPQVPLLGMDWNLVMANWAEKKAGAEMIKIRANPAEITV